MASRRYLMLGLFVALLVLGAIVVILSPNRVQQSQAEDGGLPDTIELTGIVRDFKRVHPDFNATPSGGFGHSAGDVSELLGGNRMPVYLGTGYMVNDEWRDSESRPIAPHLANAQGGPNNRDTLGLRVAEHIQVEKEAYIDAFDSNFGPYGVAGNFGGDAVVSTNSTVHNDVTVESGSYIRGDVLVGPGGSPGHVIDNKGVITGSQGVLDEAYPMPEFDLPDFLQPFVPVLELEGNVTLTGDTTPEDEDDPPPFPAMHVGKVDIDRYARVTVVGDLVIRCDGDFKMEKASIELADDATLTVYVGGKLEIKYESLINSTTGNTSVVTFNVHGNDYLKCEKKSHVYATILAPERELKVKDEAHFYGAFVGRAIKLEKKNSGIHIDRANANAGPDNFALALREKFELKEHSDLDGFDSNLGPYGPGNMGIEGLVSVNGKSKKKKDFVKIEKHATLHGDVLVGPDQDPEDAIKIKGGGEITGTVGNLIAPVAIPVVTPIPVDNDLGDFHVHGGTHTFSQDFRCDEFKAEKNARIEIAGDITIRCDDDFELKYNSDLVLLPGARLKLFVKKKVKVEKHSTFNAGGNPQHVNILRTSHGGKGKIEVKKHSELTAWVQGANTELKVEDQAHFYGSFAGKKAKVKKHGYLHIDMAYLNICLDIDDEAGAAGSETDAGIDSAATFAQWYDDVLGVNLSTPHTIELQRVDEDVYEYQSSEFFPIDGMLFGNEGQLHNYYFTYGIAADFEYEDCGGQFVEVEGGDSVWLFINDRLVIDLGGTNPGVPQRIDVDRLGLTGGERYRFNLFYSHRHASSDSFRLRTNITSLNSDGFVPNVSSQYD